MFREIEIPTRNEDKISIADIDPNTVGIIIGYYQDKPKCHIVYLEGSWIAFTSIDIGEQEYANNDKLSTLITVLLKDGIIDSAKLIEFDE